jgi:hypothetical protein
MRKLNYFLMYFFLAVCPLATWSQSNLTQTFLDKRLFLADINLMFKNFEDIQVNAFLHISKEELLLKRDSLFKTFQDSITVKDAFVLVNKLAAYLKDTHTYVENYGPIYKQYKEALLFPIKIDAGNDSKIVVVKDFSNQKLTLGDSILTINGHSANLLFNKSINMQGGLLAYQMNEAKNYFGYNLFLLDIKSPFIVTYKIPSSSEILTDTLIGIKFTEFMSRIKSGKMADYSYQLLPNKIAYLDFKAMHGSVDKFKRFLDSCFIDMRANKATGLIVDLRLNAGGNSELGELLLSYISRKQYLLSSARYAKVSNLYKQYMIDDEDNKSSPEYINFQKAEEGKVILYRYKKKNYFPENPNFYGVKTCFLIGPQNLSSATMLADGAQHFKIATLIGQPTGAPANDGGESFSFVLPYSKFKINTSSTFDIRANGNKKDTKAVMPDIFIKEASTDEDITLNCAINWINSKKQ